MRLLQLVLALLLLAGLPGANAQLPHQPERIAANDNRHPAGSLRNGVLDATLEIRRGRWFPESDSGASVIIHAFAEPGRAPSTPGPLVRARQGTRIRIAVRNTLDSAIHVHGLHTRPAEADEGFMVPAGATITREFVAGKAGTYYYWGAGAGRHLENRAAVESQLSGALVIDPPTETADASDRVFVLGIWNESATLVDGVQRPAREVLVINGKSWPHTERFTFTVGDSVRWRWVNPTAATHPMHLHGFYYTVRSRGGLGADTIYTASQRRLVNTELMRVGGTMDMSWVPEKPGNWVFHCHFAFHVGGDQVLEPAAVATGAAVHQHHKPHKMAGLVLGMTVLPGTAAAVAPAPKQPRDMRLLLQSSPKRFGAEPAFGFVLQRGVQIPARDSVALPGPTLFLKRGQPVRITVVNNLEEPSAIHWHGIELESFPDGVPDWSGMGTRIMRPIAPKDSFVAEFTPPRSGTFIYHSHLNEMKQINSGMYGALIVTDDPETFDGATDKIVIAGGGGPPPAPDADMPGFVNGSVEPAPLELYAGTTYRLRLINIHPDWRVEFTLGTDTTVAKWRPVAKDGADLPQSQRTMRSAYLLTGPGETADFEFTPRAAGLMRLQVRTRAPGWTVPVDVIVRKPRDAAVVRSP